MTSRRKAIEIKKLSAHLFWDVDADQLSWLSWVMTSSTNDLVYTLSQEVNQSAVPGYSISATWKCTLEKWQVIDSDDPGHTTRNVLIPTNGVLTVNTSICHNQGNGK